MKDDNQQKPEPMWAIVANVVRECLYRPGGAETRRGTRLFAPGSKVYCLSFTGGGEDFTVWAVGRHRASHRYMNLWISVKHLANWGVELVYSPHVISHLQSDGSPERKQELEKALQSLEVLPAFQQVQLPTLRLPKQDEQPPAEV